MKNIFLSLLIIGFLVACGGQNPKDLQGKKDELAKLKTQLAEIAGKVKTLETEIAVLDPQKAEEGKAIAVEVAQMQSATFKRYLEVQGNIATDNNVMVNPRIGGLVTKVYINEGQNVTQGQLLAELDNSVLVQSIEELKNRYDLAKTMYDKQANLWNQKIGSEIQFIQAKNNKDALEKSVATMQSQLSMSRVTAPISGVIDAVMIRAGETAMPGMGMARIVNLTDMQVKADIADSYVGSVKQGDRVIIKIPDLNKEVQGTISFVARAIDPASRTFKTEVSIANNNGELRPNMLAIVKINDETRLNAFAIEENIVQKAEMGKYVFVTAQSGGKTVAKMVIVKTGLTYNGQVEITEGLKAGDKLIVKGFQELVDGQEVKLDVQ